MGTAARSRDNAHAVLGLDATDVTCVYATGAASILAAAHYRHRAPAERVALPRHTPSPLRLWTSAHARRRDERTMAPSKPREPSVDRTQEYDDFLNTLAEFHEQRGWVVLDVSAH